VDRRRSSRFCLRLPVLTQWTDSTGQVRYGGGFSRDISLRGLFVVSSDPPAKATMIVVTVVLPNVRKASQELHLSSAGTIVRVEQNDDITGYAVDCHFSDIVDLVPRAR
jgi:PilZ domain